MEKLIVDPASYFEAKQGPNKKTRLNRVKETSSKKTDIKTSQKGNAFKHTKTGPRVDLDFVCRSGWEANVARVLKLHDIKFDFEPEVFYFPVKRGTKAYTPDFYLKKTDEWIEVKGFLDDKSRTKIKRFKTYYPEKFEKLIIITSKYNKKCKQLCEDLEINVIFYEELSRTYKDRISLWEGK